MKGFRLNSRRIVVANIDGNLRSTGSVCTHLGEPLEKGKLNGRIITCPWHGSRFDISDGKVVGRPASMPQSVYRVIVEVLMC